MSKPPLTTLEMDVRDLDGFMLNVERLLASELWALTREAPEAFRGAVGLWARSWKQLPPASLPNDDAILAAFADMPLKLFLRHKALVLRNFEPCDDGRLYHTYLAGEVQRIWPSVAKRRADRAADNERLKRWRERQKQERETERETRFATRKKRRTNGVDTDTERDTEKVRKKHIDKPNGLSRPQADNGFGQFWEAYPRKVKPERARKAYEKALKHTTAQAILDAVRAFAMVRQGEDKTFTPHPASWLNAHSWLDELDEPEAAVIDLAKV